MTFFAPHSYKPPRVGFPPFSESAAWQKTVGMIRGQERATRDVMSFIRATRRGCKRANARSSARALDQPCGRSINRANSHDNEIATIARDMGHEKPNKCRDRFFTERFLGEIGPTTSHPRIVELWPF
jgi:hypothetical protein